MTARRRPAAAAAWALVVLAVTAVLTTAAVRQFRHGRARADARVARLQAVWLARSGVELAVARLAADPAGYTGETVRPVPGGEVAVVVRPDGPGRFRIESTARVTATERWPVTAVDRRVVVRTADGVRIEPAADGPSG